MLPRPEDDRVAAQAYAGIPTPRGDRHADPALATLRRHRHQHAGKEFSAQPAGQHPQGPRPRACCAAVPRSDQCGQGARLPACLPRHRRAHPTAGGLAIQGHAVARRCGAAGVPESARHGQVRPPGGIPGFRRLRRWHGGRHPGARRRHHGELAGRAQAAPGRAAARGLSPRSRFRAHRRQARCRPGRRRQRLRDPLRAGRPGLQERRRRGDRAFRLCRRTLAAAHACERTGEGAAYRVRPDGAAVAVPRGRSARCGRRVQPRQLLRLSQARAGRRRLQAGRRGPGRRPGHGR